MSETSDDEVEDTAQSRFVLVDDLDTLCCALDTLSDMDVQCVSIDTEGTNLSRKGKLCIMQVGLPRDVPVSEQVYIIDVLTLGKQAFEYEEEGTSLKGLLQDSRITKWMCDCRRDSDALYHQFGIRLQNVVDLQLAEVAARRMTGDPAPRVLGLQGILDKYLPVADLQDMLPYRTKTEAIKQTFDADPTSWERRPLTPDQVIYAATDVAFMGRLAELVYETLPDEIKAKVVRVSEERLRWYAEPDEKALFDGTERAIAPLF